MRNMPQNLFFHLAALIWVKAGKSAFDFYKFCTIYSPWINVQEKAIFIKRILSIYGAAYNKINPETYYPYINNQGIRPKAFPTHTEAMSYARQQSVLNGRTIVKASNPYLSNRHIVFDSLDLGGYTFAHDFEFISA